MLICRNWYALFHNTACSMFDTIRYNVQLSISRPQALNNSGKPKVRSSN
jgi:hypothetical protein